MTEPNDFNLPMGSGLYRTILRSFNTQGRLVVDRVRGERRTEIWYTPDELLRPSDPNLLDEVDAFIPEITGIWERSGKRLFVEVGFDAARWRVVSEFLRSAIRDSVLDFAESTQATFRDDLRMTYEEIKAAIRKELDEGRLQAGESMPELTKRLLKFFREGNRPRARRIAQTEATRAHHLARERSAKESGVVIGWEWRATSASCPVCDAIAADSTSPDGQRRVKLGQPFAFVGKNPTYREVRFPPAHPHCVLGETPVRMASLVSGTQAKYHGPIVRMVFGDGSRAAVTPNHMLLTRTGFARAADLVKGDDVICAGLGEFQLASPSGRCPNINRNPVLAKDVIRAMAESGGMTSSAMPISAEYLHGDSAFVDGQINVIWANGLLRGNRQPPFGQPMEHGGFVGGVKPAAKFLGSGDLASSLEALRLATDSGMSGLREAKAILWGSSRHANEHRLGLTSGNKSNFLEPANNHRAADAETIGDALHRFAGIVSTTKVVEIDFDPSRHETHSVYDFETLESMYIIGNGIVSSNCRCTTLPILDPVYSGDPTPIYWSGPLIR